MWFEDIKNLKRNCNFVLVGTKSDLLRRAIERNGINNVVTKTEAKALLNRLGAKETFECSALKNENIENIFESCIKYVYQERMLIRDIEVCCILF